MTPYFDTKIPQNEVFKKGSSDSTVVKEIAIYNFHISLFKDKNAGYGEVSSETFAA